MFAGDSQMLRNKCHFVISLIAINMFYCIYLLGVFSQSTNNVTAFGQSSSFL